jgi:hypothetical protein
VIDARPEDGEPQGYVHGFAEPHELHRDGRLVVVHREHSFVASLGSHAERCLGRDRAHQGDVEPGAPSASVRSSNSWHDGEALFTTEKAPFAGVRIERRHGDSRTRPRGGEAREQVR